MSKCKVIAMCNQKGGVGKTTVTMNLGIGLARAGKRVLLVDSDPQGNLTTALGFQETEKLNMTLASVYDVLIDGQMPPEDCMLHCEENVDLIPSNILLSSVDMKLISTMCRESHLKRFINQQREHYDYILIDCLPTLGVLVQNALTAADSVIIPTQAQYMSAVGLTQLLGTIEQVRRGLNPELQIDGILFTMVESRVIGSQEIMTMFRQLPSVHVFDAYIPKTVRFQEASKNGQSIFLEDKNGKGAKAITALVNEVQQENERGIR